MEVYIRDSDPTRSLMNDGWRKETTLLQDIFFLLPFSDSLSFCVSLSIACLVSTLLYRFFLQFRLSLYRCSSKSFSPNCIIYIYKCVRLRKDIPRIVNNYFVRIFYQKEQIYYYPSNRIETIFVKNVSFYTRGWCFYINMRKKRNVFIFFFN